MEYELLKQLKDAGFPNIKLCERTDEHKISECGECASEHKPTLSELIESCGGSICLITGVKCVVFWYEDRLGCGIEVHKSKYMTGGSTPIEAVIKLYLALNKK